MSMQVKKDYRLRITESNEYRTYISRSGGKGPIYISSSETPLALSNLIGDDAAETRFKLTDARDGREAHRILTEVLRKKWRNNMAMCPKVEVL